jgi:hypothetical protein
MPKRILSMEPILKATEQRVSQPHMYTGNLAGLILVGPLACSVAGVCTTGSASIEEMPYEAIVLYSDLARYYVLQGLMVLAVLRGRCYTAPADRPIHGGRVAFTVFSTIPHLFATMEQAIGGALVVLLNRLPLNPFAAQA